MNIATWFSGNKPAVASAARELNYLALDNSSTCFMIADSHGVITYANKAVLQLLTDAEQDIRKELPDFSVDRIVGTNIDSFHKNPTHQRNILARLTATHIARLKVGGRSFRLVLNPLRDLRGQLLGTSVEWHDITEAERKELRMKQIITALGVTTTNIMVADADRVIIYMNQSVETMLRSAEADLRKALPHFSVDKIIGSNMDIFHANPAHQSRLLSELKSTYEANITVAGRHFRLIANPIIDDSGERLGSVVEWQDRTQEVMVENEISSVVASAALGDFTARIGTSGKKNFFLNLAEGLNSLLNTTEKGLNDINTVLRAISQGNLTERVTEDYQGSFEALKDGCNQTADNLAAMLTEIREAAETINTASSEISQGNTDLSSRTEEQASSLEETASSMEELTSTVRQNADNARQANALAAKAADVAVEGGSLIEKVVSTMASINESAQKISDIIGVIDGIAFQTNILALNAAVEAARAGEQGRGFAVVASEVRTLAQRSANAAKDIKVLISDSVSKINNGNELVGQSGNTMKEIVVSIKRVNDIMAEIAAASAEQSAGLDEVGKAVAQMDEMTQQNAALVEEAAAASESLLSQAEQLARNVARFKLEAGAHSHAHTPTPVSRPATPAAPKERAAIKKTAPALIKPARSGEDEWESF